MQTRARGRGRDGLFVALVFLAALAFRFAPFPDATAHGWRLLSPDCYGHLRRTVSVARNFPRVPFRDPYLNHPDGGVFIWPPAFDLLAGGISRALYGASATTEQVTRVAATLPAVLGALHVVPLFFLARRVFGRRRARIAAAAYVAIPAAVLWGGFGHFDHHVAEALNLLLVLAAGAWAAAAPPGERLARAAAFGAAIALAVLTWQGAVFVAGLGLAWAAVALGEGAGAAALAAAVLVAGGAALTLPREPVPFAFVSFGWFQPALLAGAAVPLLALSAWRAPSPRRRVLWGLGAAAALAVALPNAGRVLDAVFRGGTYVFKEGAGARGGRLRRRRLPLLPSRVPAPRRRVPAARFRLVHLRSAPCASSPRGSCSSRSPSSCGSGPRRAAPCFLRARRAATRALVALFAGAVFVMALFQQRNVYYLSIFAALALAEATARLCAAPPARPRARIRPDRPRLGPRRPPGRAVPRARGRLRERPRRRRPRALRAPTRRSTRRRWIPPRCPRRRRARSPA